MEAPETSLEIQIDNLLDAYDVNSAEAGVMRLVAANEGDLSGLSPKQRGVWDRRVVPALIRQQESRDRRHSKALMDRDD